LPSSGIDKRRVEHDFIERVSIDAGRSKAEFHQDVGFRAEGLFFDVSGKQRYNAKKKEEAASTQKTAAVQKAQTAWLYDTGWRTQHMWHYKA
jgi:uncharacterized protein YecT (DUF1311 family)